MRMHSINEIVDKNVILLQKKYIFKIKYTVRLELSILNISLNIIKTIS